MKVKVLERVAHVEREGVVDAAASSSAEEARKERHFLVEIKDCGRKKRTVELVENLSGIWF